MGFWGLGDALQQRVGQLFSPSPQREEQREAPILPAHVLAFSSSFEGEKGEQRGELDHFLCGEEAEQKKNRRLSVMRESPSLQELLAASPSNFQREKWCALMERVEEVQALTWCRFPPFALSTLPSFFHRFFSLRKVTLMGWNRYHVDEAVHQWELDNATLLALKTKRGALEVLRLGAAKKECLLSCLQEHPELEELAISHSCTLEDQQLIEGSEVLKKLKKISLNHCPYVTGKGLGELLQANPHLEVLELGGLEQVSQKQWQQLAEKSQNLRALILRSGLTLSPKAVRAFLKRSPGLKLLICEGSHYLSDGEAQAMSSFLKKLEILGCVLGKGELTSWGLGTLTQHASALRHLSLDARCPDEEPFHPFGKKWIKTLSGPKSLYLTRLKGVDEEEVRECVKQHTSLSCVELVLCGSRLHYRNQEGKVCVARHWDGEEHKLVVGFSSLSFPQRVERFLEEV